MGLDVDVVGPEEFLAPLDRERLRDIDEFAASLTKFSEAMSSSLPACRSVSRRMAAAISGSTWVNADMYGYSSSGSVDDVEQTSRSMARIFSRRL